MTAFLALIATVLTSFLPILNKRLLQDARPMLVAAQRKPKSSHETSFGQGTYERARLCALLEL